MSDYYPSFYPTFGEFMALAVLSVLLCAAGGLFLAWTREKGSDQPSPLWLTVAVAAVTAVIYISTTWYLIEHVFWKRKLTMIAYAMAFWTIPLAFYTRLVMNALATTTVEKLSWLDAHVGDTSEFTMARELAEKGDIDGAVRVYRNYTKNKLGALNEAAHLLYVHHRVEDALNLYKDIAERFADNRPAVTNALFRQAQILEKDLGRMDEAQALYRRVYTQSPDSEQGRKSAEALRRVHGDGDLLLSALDAAYNGHDRDENSGSATSPAPHTAASE